MMVFGVFFGLCLVLRFPTVLFSTRHLHGNCSEVNLAEFAEFLLNPTGLACIASILSLHKMSNSASMQYVNEEAMGLLNELELSEGAISPAYGSTARAIIMLWGTKLGTLNKTICNFKVHVVY